ncbi:MAG: gliding motility-associated C-terminal domain-containing protein [Bacteroidales bacterium]|nr:gliding motility-associated C-terminal domain-containing protein [Bacteroidales bacterium]
MTGSLSGNIKRLILSLFVILGFSWSLFSQTKINGVINMYGRVTSIGTDYVIVDDTTQFAQFSVGDTVLLIQMKGVRIYSIEAATYGMPESSYGPSGMHEFLIIESVDGGTKRIVFRNNIVHTTFSIEGAVQIIKVPSYNNALVDEAPLSSQPWDSISKTGGVLSVIVGNTLSLNANIDVSSQGFIGGSAVLGLGICVGTNSTRYDKYAFHRDSLNSGFKGEGPVTRGWLDLSTFPAIYPKYAKGKGTNFTGGGGGNGRFSGGGGGANYGAGGRGGREMATCTGPVDGGLGGKQIKVTPLAGGMFLGGGGGSSTYLAGSTASPGGNGAGIVIIVCDTLKGNNRSILANGAGADAATGTYAGAGGGGAGGTVALYLQSYSTSNLTISANGGKGGNNPGTFGEGGGGGGGLITTSNATTPGNVTKTITFGLVGTRSGVATGGNGAAGENLTSFVPVLNGFLFNSIRSSITGDQTDSICSNIIPKLITGTSPVGGSGTYTYLWQKSYNLAGAAADIPSSNTLNYGPSATEPVGDVWFRRVVKDDVTLLTDTSKWVKIIVQPAITGNLVGKDTTICYGQNPLSLVPLNSGPSNGNGKSYYYQWLQDLANTTWVTAQNAEGANSTLASFDPPALNITTYYKRIVTSGRCIDTSSTVSVDVLPLITGNITSRPDSVICEGSVFIPLGASSAGGGTGIYTYQWQDSAASVSGNWLPASGINTNQTHSPDTSVFTITDSLRFFRRVVFSGPDNVCKSVSSPIRLTRYPKIKNNAITADNIICSGTIPDALTGTTPLQGSGIYTYIWQDSLKSGSWSDRGTLNSLSFATGLTDTTWYRRIVNSSKCTNKSNILVINVHKPIENNTISLLSGGLSDTTICNGALPNLLKGGAILPSGGTGIPGDYAYQWSSSPDNSNWTDISTSATGPDYHPTLLTATTYYRRRVISGECTDESGSINITVLPLIKDNSISASQTICKDESPDLLSQASGIALSGGAGTYLFLWEESADGTTWNPATGTNNAPTGSYQPPALSKPIQYRRIAKSGANDCCVNTSNTVNIAIDSLPADFIISAGPDTNLYSFDHIMYMAAEPVLWGGTGTWTLVTGAGTGVFDNPNNNLTRITGLSLGLNRFLWTVQVGACIREDMVDVNVYGILVPEGFSPNDDSFNDLLEIKGLDLDNQVAELIIVNSAGTEVFATNNRNGAEWTDWDGKNSTGDSLPEGTYYYLLKLTSKGNGQVFPKSGFIILKRY